MTANDRPLKREGKEICTAFLEHRPSGGVGVVDVATIKKTLRDIVPHSVTFYCIRYT